MGFTKNISANCRSQNRPSLDVRNSQIIREEIRKDSRWRHQYDNGAGLRPVEYCTQRTYVKQQPRKTSRGDTMRSTCHTDFTYPQVTREMESASLTTPRTVVSDDGIFANELISCDHCTLEGRASHPRLSSLLCELDVNKPPSRGYTIGTPGKVRCWLTNMLSQIVTDAVCLVGHSDISTGQFVQRSNGGPPTLPRAEPSATSCIHHGMSIAHVL